MRVGIVGSLTDSRCTLFHYHDFLLTRDAEAPARWGRPRVVSLAIPGIFRRDGLCIVHGPTLESVAHLLNADTTPDPTVAIVLAQEPLKDAATSAVAYAYPGQTMRLIAVKDGVVYEAGDGMIIDRSKEPKRDDYEGPPVKRLDLPLVAVKPKKKAEPAPIEAPPELAPPVEESPSN